MNRVKLTPSFGLWECQCKCGCNQVIVDSTHLANKQAFSDWLNKGKKSGDPGYIPLVSNSSYRCETHNKSDKVRGAVNSQHRLGAADDFIASSSGMTVMELYAKALEFGKFRGVIAYPNRGIVHMDSRKAPVYHNIDYS